MRSRATIALSIWLAACSFATAWALYTRFESGNAARADNRHIWHAVVCTVEAAELQDHPALSDRLHIEEFWNNLLIEDVGARPCVIGPRT